MTYVVLVCIMTYVDSVCIMTYEAWPPPHHEGAGGGFVSCINFYLYSFRYTGFFELVVGVSL